MRTEVRIRFDTKDVPGGAPAILGPAGCGPDVTRVRDIPALRQIEACITLDESDPRVPVLLGLLKRHGVLWSGDHEDLYTEEELDSARLLVMHPNRQCEIDGGVEWGMTYDLSVGCRACGTGARQTSPAFVRGEQLSELEGHRAGATWFGHVLVDEALAADLESRGLTGVVFHNVYAIMPDTRQVKLRWRQLCGERSLPPMSPRTTGIGKEDFCKSCGRSGFSTKMDDPPRPMYRAADLRGSQDVNTTWEWFGPWKFDGNVSNALFSYPWFLMTPKVWRVFRDAGVASFHWFPIRVEEDRG
jgi:hypothetical protein